MTDALLYRYYDAFNRHQLAEAAALFADGARFESPWGDVGDGRTGYQRFAETWLLAFPTAQLRLQHVEQRNATTCEAYVLATGTHRGMFAFDRYRFPPTEAEVRLHLRELLDIRDGRILRSMIAIDLHDLIQQLATIDYETLRDKLARIRTLSEAIEQAADDLDRQRALALQLGPELDAARHALRPHFTR